MAYMCADSGNLMAIAQQVIQQKQKQQQQQQQNQEQTQLQIQNHENIIASASQTPTLPHPPWTSGPHPHDPFPSSFLLPDPFDDWMDSLIGESHPDAWHASQPFDPSDLSHVVFPDHPASLTAAGELTHSDLRSLLIDCARIIDSDAALAATALTRIRELATDIGDPNERLAFYFSEALARRLKPKDFDFHPDLDSSPEEFTICYKVLNDACPYSNFAYLTANQAILEATENSDRIHIIDFGIVQGVQWAALLQALATRSTKKPAKIRISGFPAPALGDSPAGSLSATAVRLRNFASLLDLDFEFDPILTPIQELNESTFRIDPNETVAVNFMLQLYNYLEETPSLIQRILRIAKLLNPSVVTLGEYEANLNRVGFFDRFVNGLNYYSSVFESIDPRLGRDSVDRVRVEKVLLGSRILRAVGPERGRFRGERMEERQNWTALMEGCGLHLLPLSHYAVSQAKLLLWIYGHSKKFSVLDSVKGFLSLAWDERPLLTVSSWS